MDATLRDLTKSIRAHVSVFCAAIAWRFGYLPRTMAEQQCDKLQERINYLSGARELAVVGEAEALSAKRLAESYALSNTEGLSILRLAFNGLAEHHRELEMISAFLVEELARRSDQVAHLRTELEVADKLSDAKEAQHNRAIAFEERRSRSLRGHITRLQRQQRAHSTKAAQ